MTRTAEEVKPIDPTLLLKEVAGYLLIAQLTRNSRLVKLSEDGNLRLLDYPISVSGPNPSLTIGQDGEIISLHKPPEVKRILGQVRQTLQAEASPFKAKPTSE